jgi:hypothetical protein
MLVVVVAVVQSLNRQRGVQQDITASFDRLCSILMHFLDACDADGDVACAKMAMIMVGLTFPETDTVLSRRVDCQELLFCGVLHVAV